MGSDGDGRYAGDEKPAGFSFDWELSGWTRVTVRLKEGGSNSTPIEFEQDAIFSRAIIPDKDLLHKGKEPEIDEMAKKFQHKLSVTSLDGAAENRRSSTPDEQQRTPPRPKSAKLPDVCYWGRYWREAKQWVCASAWANSIFAKDEEKRKKLLDDILGTDTVRPKIVLDAHATDENLETFGRLLFDTNAEFRAQVEQISDGSSEKVPWWDAQYGEWWPKHCSLVEDAARSSFDAAMKQREVRRNNVELMNKVDCLGYTTRAGSEQPVDDRLVISAFAHSQSTTVADNPLAVPMGDTEVSCETTSEFYCGTLNTRFMAWERQQAPSTSSTPMTNSTLNEGEEIVNDSNSGESPPKGNQGQKNDDGDNEDPLRLAYDEKLDAKLLAKNARQKYQNDPELHKYFYQRYRLFSRFDEGIVMDREGWFSVTPERIAKHIAERICSLADKQQRKRSSLWVLDAFTGVGGNAIQIALLGANVVCIDLDPVRLRCARRNAEIYGVAHRCHFFLGDFFHVSERMKKKGIFFDAVFLSPPWGGPSYSQHREFYLELGCQPCGIRIFHTARKISPNVVYFLPRNTCVEQLIALAGPGGRVEIEQAVLNKKRKAIHAYYGELVESVIDAPREGAGGHHNNDDDDVFDDHAAV